MRAGLAFPLVALLLAGPAAAVGGTITDQAVSVTYPANHWGSSPWASFTGTEPVPTADVVYHSGWFYRVNGLDTREHPLPPPDSESWSGAAASLNWNDVDGKGFSLTENLSVFDQERPAGTFRSQLSATNLTGAHLSVSFFHYLDADAGGTWAGDTGQRLTSRLLSFVDGDSNGLYRGEDADAFAVGAAPAIRDQLNDASSTDLDDSGTPFGPGDWTAAFQWNVELGPGSPGYTFPAVVVSSRVPGCTVKGDLSWPDNFADICFWRADTSRHWSWWMRRTARHGSTGWDAPTRPLATDDFTGNCLQDSVEMDAAGQVWFDDREGLPIALTGGPVLPSNWKLTATADFDRDGRPDILWRNADSQRLVVWKMGSDEAPGTQKTGNLSPSPDHALDANWEAVAAADYDGDGHVDLLWYNPVSGRTVIWYLDASLVRVTGAFTSPPAAADANWRVVASADYGKGASVSWGTPDLLWRNTTSGKLVVWHMNWGGGRASGVFTTPSSPGDLAWQVFGPR